MLNLNCPNCGSPHRIDNAFRGGVARCQACGALIHVPTKDGKPIEAQTGRKKRPRTPDTPAATRKGARRGKVMSMPPSKRRAPGKLIAIVLVVSVLAISALAVWWIYSTAMNARAGG